MKNMTKLYADDTMILSTVNTDLNVREIQNDLDRDFNWRFQMDRRLAITI